MLLRTNPFRVLVFSILFIGLAFALPLNAQNEGKDKFISFVMVDDNRFPDLAVSNNIDEKGSCELIKAWVEKNNVTYFQLLQSGESILKVNTDSISHFTLQNQKDFMLAFEKLKPSIQCQRFQLVFYKSDETNLHHEKVVKHFYYLVSKNDFLFLKSKVNE